MKLQIEPRFRGEDKGDGGIRRVVEAQKKYLPAFGIEVVENGADVVALHAGNHIDTNKPVVVHCHGLYWKEYKWPDWHYKLNREVSENIRRANIVTVPSEWVANAIRRAFLIDPIVVPHGVEPMPLSSGEGNYVLWNKARQDVICDPKIVHQLARHAPEVKFVSTFGNDTGINNLSIIGKQGYKESLVTLNAASVYLSTTKETFGIGTLEAMAMGIPILGWNYGGQVNLVEHKVNGWLAEFGDYEGLLEGLHYCLANRNKLGAAGRRIAIDKYNWQTVMQQYANIYQNVKKNDSLVSAVIPCYNLGKYLTGAVESIVRQVDEIIIVDDASTDDSYEIAVKLSETHPSVNVIKNATNKHVAETRNIGIAASKHGFILPLDADDMMAPRSVNLLRNALIKDSNIDIAYGACQFINTDGSPIQEIGPNGVSKWPPEFKWDGLHKYPFSYCPATSLFRREVWERTGGFRSRYKGVEDADFWTRALSIGLRPAKITEAITLIHTVRENSLGQQETAKYDWTKWYPRYGVIPPEGEVSISSCDDVKISIIIPVGPGHEGLVINALDSVWMQDFNDWECIVVNDTGGEDLKVPSWVKQIHNYNDMYQSPSRARNAAIRAAKGKLIYFLDADDYLIHQSALSSMYKTWKDEYGKAVGGGFVYTDWTDDNGKLHVSMDNVCKDALSMLPTPVNILYERSANVFFDTDMLGWEEWDFVLQLLNKGYCGTRISYPMFKYNTKSGTVRNKAHENRDQIVRLLDEKWGPYKRGEKELACGCGGRRTVTYNNGMSMESDHLGQTLLEFTTNTATRTYRGPVTGATYRFGLPGHKIRYVDDRDVDGLLRIIGFRVYEGVGV